MTSDPDAPDSADAPGTVPECPNWCTGVHEPGSPGLRIHRGPVQTSAIRARRLIGPEDDAATVADTEFSVGLVQYGDGERTWLRVRTTTGEPLEIDIVDANRWVMLMGSVMVRS